MGKSTATPECAILRIAIYCLAKVRYSLRVIPLSREGIATVDVGGDVFGIVLNRRCVILNRRFVHLTFETIDAFAGAGHLGQTIEDEAHVLWPSRLYPSAARFQ